MTAFGIILGLIITVFLGMVGSKMNSSDGEFTKERQGFLDTLIGNARIKAENEAVQRRQDEAEWAHRWAGNPVAVVLPKESAIGKSGDVLWRWDLVDRNQQYGLYPVYQPGTNLLLTVTFKSDKKFNVGQDLLEAVVKSARAKTYTVGRHPIPVAVGSDGFWSATAEISVSERELAPCSAHTEPCK